MHCDAPQWLASLKQQAAANHLEYLDLVINATLLDYPLLQRLAELDPPPLQSLLFEKTPEYALAAQGPVLIRVLWQQTAQMEWLAEFLPLFHGESRALALLSHWPFDALSEHLRYCTQAEWDSGTNSGILRYYDTRLVKLVSDQLAGDDSRHFHAAVISWHWIDRDLKAQSIGGYNLKRHEYVCPEAPLRFDEQQMYSMRAWSTAEQWEQTHGLSKRNYSVSKEGLITQIYLGHLAARGTSLDGQALTDFIVEWLTKYLPETLPEKGGWV